MASVPALTETRPERFAQALRDLFAGRSNAVGTVTLAAEDTDPVTSTTVTGLNVGPASRIFLFPASADAASIDWVSGDLHISTVGAGTFTIAHSSNASVDRTFFWVALG